jgi:hypothetical protein
LVAIKTHKPTLFLDIDMPEKMGLNWLTILMYCLWSGICYRTCQSIYKSYWDKPWII